MKYNDTVIESAALSNSTSSVSELTIRANYLTLCASAAGDMVCTTSKNTTDLGTISSTDSSTDGVSLVVIASALSLVCTPYLLITALVIVLLLTIVVLWQLMPFVPGKVIARKICAAAALLASLVWGLGAMLQHQAIVSAEAFVEAATLNYISVERGSKAEALSWTAFLFLVITFFALLFRVFRDHRQLMALDEKC
ncbi:hypothetical protein METBIDRAFT_11799 [Metschnikowia bicuspidata var. bicuspidata NRRL YB-4993]|uniref:MARVEL domain-containing protein n=1 Tax=Metschnikowia bicuspidata var. bicuspidata NRRL YB-4993 TaxID=869754 RepID=A0A1A0HAU7_9ASCO|nr:hypothetical protein METBIDRAFT_11799 [Metschnikowia bicuspidata var. bicuspidata NRRL YB-4993]OBA21244.1 hypothetical protein METBIDRAFT_11799 [Metschnikowia bicuspidata var. bicuspidata NRRL YB-4993]